MDLVEKKTVSWANSPYLGARHGDKDANCRGCHGEIFSTFGETLDN
jgi:hypothetical protein